MSSEGEEPQLEERSQVPKSVIDNVNGNVYCGSRTYGKGNKVQQGNRTEYLGFASANNTAASHQQHLYNMNEKGGEDTIFHDGDTVHSTKGLSEPKVAGTQEMTWEARGKAIYVIPSGTVAEGKKEKERRVNR